MRVVDSRILGVDPTGWRDELRLMLHDLVVQLVLHELLEQVLVLLLRLRIGLHFLGALIQVVFYNLLQFVADVHPASGIWLSCLVQPMARILLTLASALAVAHIGVNLILLAMCLRGDALQILLQVVLVVLLLLLVPFLFSLPVDQLELGYLVLQHLVVDRRRCGHVRFLAADGVVVRLALTGALGIEVSLIHSLLVRVVHHVSRGSWKRRRDDLGVLEVGLLHRILIGELCQVGISL